MQAKLHESLKAQRIAEQRGEEERGGEGESILKIGFWNVVGLDNKDRQFWDYVAKFDYIGLVETWVEEKCSGAG